MLTQMKNRIWMVLLIVFLVSVLLLPGCGRKDEKYGQSISSKEVTEIEQILTEPVKYAGKTVTLEGDIIRQCPTGCWFDMQQGKGRIYVDLNPSGFAIPQKPGKTVLVEGQVQYKDQRASLIATGVEIK